LRIFWENQGYCWCLRFRAAAGLSLKDWAFASAKRSTMRKARVAPARRLAIIMHAMLRDGTGFEFA
jgi:transposase